jgi:Protein of unknown function (DUF3352)
MLSTAFAEVATASLGATLPPMRRLIALALLAAALLAAALLAGCGSSSSSSKKVDPTGAALSYFPASTPFVMTAATDPNSAAAKQSQTLSARIPAIALGKAAAIERLQQLGINYQTDLRPLFGNPIAIGATTATLSGAASSQFLVSWVTKSASKLKALVAKFHALHAAGTRDGAQLYSGSGLGLAVSGATLLFSPNPGAVTAALDRHAHGGGVTSAQRASETSGLSSASALQAFGSLTNVLSGPSSAIARRVPWVAAIRGYGLALNSSSSGFTIQYRVDTTGGSLTSAQLPLASGSTPPSLAGDLPIEMAIRDPAQVARFAESAAQAANPASYAKFLTREAAFKRKTGLDLNSLVGLLTGDLIVESDTHTTIGRATVSNPATAAGDLRKLVAAPKGIFNKGTSYKSLGGGLYEVRTSSMTLTIGVIGSQLVLGRASTAAVRSFATAPTTPATGASGALTFKVSLLDLLHTALKHPPSQRAQALLKLLGNVTGSTSASPSGLSGSATLSLR